MTTHCEPEQPRCTLSILEEEPTLWWLTKRFIHKLSYTHWKQPSLTDTQTLLSVIETTKCEKEKRKVIRKSGLSSARWQLGIVALICFSGQWHFSSFHTNNVVYPTDFIIIIHSGCSSSSSSSGRSRITLSHSNLCHCSVSVLSKLAKVHPYTLLTHSYHRQICHVYLFIYCYSY